MLRNRRTADWETASQFADGQGPPPEPFEQGAASHISDGVELPLLVSFH